MSKHRHAIMLLLDSEARHRELALASPDADKRLAAADNLKASREVLEDDEQPVKYMLVATIKESAKSDFINTYGPFESRQAAKNYRKRLITYAVRERIYVDRDAVNRNISFRIGRLIEKDI